MAVAVDDHLHARIIGETLKRTLLCCVARSQVAVRDADAHLSAGDEAVCRECGLQLWRIYVPVHGDNWRYAVQQLQHSSATYIAGMQYQVDVLYPA
jgi:hypothetical protein